MPRVVCAGCGSRVDESDTYFGTAGTICAQCHANEEAYDDWKFSAGAAEVVRRQPGVTEHEERLRRGPRPHPKSAYAPGARRDVEGEPTHCPRCGDEIGDAGAYHASDGNGFVCVSCAFT